MLEGHIRAVTCVVLNGKSIITYIVVIITLVMTIVF